MINLKEILTEPTPINEAMEWKDVPQAEKDEAYKLVKDHNDNPAIDQKIDGFYFIDVTGKYQVYYTFWRYKRMDPKFAAFITNPVYMGNLTTDLVDAVKKAIEKMPPTVKLELVHDETRKNLIGKTTKVMKFTFGKYRGRSFPEVYLEKPDYFIFLAKNQDPQYENTKINQAIKFFANLAYEEIKEKNLATSTSQYVGKKGETYEGELEVYSIKDKMGQFGPYQSYKLKDVGGNKFLANNVQKSFPSVKVGDKIKIKGTIQNQIELLGVKFTALGRIKSA